jgi:4-aminobutyrate aminotransferase
MSKASVMDWPIGAHGNTFGGNPVSCQAGIATLDLVENGLMENAAELGEYILDAMSELQTRHSSIGDVRGKGLMIGTEFVQDRETRKPAGELRDRIVEQAFQRGLITLGSGKSSVRFAPPLNIDRGLVDEALKIFDAAITAATKP